MLYSNIKTKANRRASYSPRLEQIDHGHHIPDEENDRPSSRPKSVIFTTNNPIAQITEIMNNERPKIDVRLPTVEELQKERENTAKLIGKSLKETFNLYFPFFMKLSRFILFYLVGVVFYENVEQWSFQDCVYFITMTITTVGYGNITPSTVSGQIFTMFYIYCGILLVFSIVGEILQWMVVTVRSNYQKPLQLNKLQVLVRSLINMFMWLVILFTIPIVGAIFFYFNEGLSFQEAMYFTVVTASSTGYGDIIPVKTSSTWFNIFFILISVSLTALALDKISSFKRHLEEAELWQILDAIEPSKALVNAINPKAEKASEAEFILHMLQLEGKLDYINDIARWKEKFNEFDLDKDGFITMNDCSNYSKVVRRRMKFPTARTQRKKSVVGRVAEETKAVFLETIGAKNPNINVKAVDEIVVEQLQQPQSIVSPKVRAKALKRASTMDDVTGTKKDIESNVPKSKREHSPIGGSRLSASRGMMPIPRSESEITIEIPMKTPFQEEKESTNRKSVPRPASRSHRPFDINL